MISHQLEPGAARSFFLILEEDDEVIETLEAFAEQQEIEAARFSGIGAFREAEVAFFQADEEEPRNILLDEQVQVLSCIGTIGVSERAPIVHAHVVVALVDGHARGGHLISGKVRPKLELVVLELPGVLRRLEVDSRRVPSLEREAAD